MTDAPPPGPRFAEAIATFSAGSYVGTVFLLADPRARRGGRCQARPDRSTAGFRTPAAKRVWTDPSVVVTSWKLAV